MQFRQAPEENFQTYMQLDELDCDKHMLVINDGRQYLSIRQKHVSFQLHCEGHDSLHQCNHFCINMNLMDGVEQKVAKFKQLMKLFNKTKEPLPAPLSSQKLKLFKESLQAVYARREDVIYRDIAIVYFGKERVMQEWSESSRALEDYVRFRVKKGLKLMRGGYKDLL